MDRLLQADKDAYLRAMRAEVDALLGQVVEAVNNAPDGNVINGSEMRVRDVMAELRRRAFERALQMRIDATEAGFSPSGKRGGGKEAKQGAGTAEQSERQWKS